MGINPLITSTSSPWSRSKYSKIWVGLTRAVARRYNRRSNLTTCRSKPEPKQNETDLGIRPERRVGREARHRCFERLVFDSLILRPFSSCKVHTLVPAVLLWKATLCLPAPVLFFGLSTRCLGLTRAEKNLSSTVPTVLLS